MAKCIPDDQLDVALEDIQANGNIMHLCTDQPANYAGIAAVSCGSVALGSGDYTIADGDTSGRKITVAGKTVTITADGDVDHIVIADTVNEAIKGITTCTETAVTTSELKPVEAFDLWEIGDPA